MAVLRAAWCSLLLAACAARGDRAPQDEVATRLAALGQALGGKARAAELARIEARHVCRGPAGEYVLESVLPREGTWSFRWLFPGRPPSTIELVGEAGWSVDGDGARAPLTPAEAWMVRSHAFPWLALDFARFFRNPEAAGTRAEDGRTFARLALIDPLGRRALAELDVETGLLAALELEDGRSQPPRPVRVVFEAWCEREGLRFPERVVAHDASGAWTLALDTLQLEFAP